MHPEGDVMQVELQQLNGFFGAAALATYAGGSGYVQPLNKGFNEMEYRQNDWYYRDSFCGFFKSWGKETVWYKDRPVWVQNYGGGMEAAYQGDEQFAQKTFNFLKLALAKGKKQEAFQPRGPERFKKGKWTYLTTLTGGIQKFSGIEHIFYGTKLVFTHRYFGGVVLDKGE